MEATPSLACLALRWGSVIWFCQLQCATVDGSEIPKNKYTTIYRGVGATSQTVVGLGISEPSTVGLLPSIS